MLLIEKITLSELKKCWNSIYNAKNDDIRRYSKGIDEISLAEFKKNEDENLKKLHSQIKKNTFNFFPLKAIPSLKKNGKYRVLTVPTVRDRILHKTILSIVTPFFYKHINTGVSYCGVKKDFWKEDKTSLRTKNAFEKIVEYTKKKHFWIFESDLKSFFDKVKKERLLNKIYKILPDESLNKFFRDIIYFSIGNKEEPNLVKKVGKTLESSSIGISQGSSLSPILSNVFLIEFDQHMKKYFDDRFIRYVDDFIVICKTEEEANHAKEIAKNFLIKEGLNLSEDPDPKETKTKIVNLKKNNQIKFLGFSISKRKIAPKKEKNEIKKWIDSEVLCIKKYEEIKRNGKKIPIIELINEKLLGWANSYRFIDIKDLFDEVEKILEGRRKTKPSQYKNLVSLKNIEIEPVILNENWEKLFQ